MSEFTGKTCDLNRVWKFCHSQKLMWIAVQIWFNAQRNRELSRQRTREMRCLPEGKVHPMTPCHPQNIWFFLVCWTGLVIRMPIVPKFLDWPLFRYLYHGAFCFQDWVWGESRAKDPPSCKHMHRWVKTKRNPLGKSVSSVIQSDIALFWLMKHVQDQDSAAHKSLRNLLHHMSQG